MLDLWFIFAIGLGFVAGFISARILVPTELRAYSVRRIK